MMEEDNFFKFQPRIQRLGQPKPTKAGSGLEENGQKFEKRNKNKNISLYPFDDEVVCILYTLSKFL